MEPYKLQLLTEDDDGVEDFRDFYLDVSKIESFYIPNVITIQDEELSGINIYMSGQCFSVKQEDHIIEYLTERFVKKSVKPKKINGTG